LTLFIYLYVVVFVACLNLSAFMAIGSKDAWGGYQEDYPRAMLFASRFGLSTPNSYIGHVDVLDLSGVVMAPYEEHREACPFEPVSLYSGWLGYSNRTMRYLSERVFHQFVYVQTVPRHPCESAPPQQTLREITLCFQRALDYALTPQELGHPALYGVEAAYGYIHLFYDSSRHGGFGVEVTRAGGHWWDWCSGGWIAWVLRAEWEVGSYQIPCVCCYVLWWGAARVWGITTFRGSIERGAWWKGLPS